MTRLDGRVALVTGAGRGIGRATALKLASEGARVVVNDLDEAPAADVVAEIHDLGGSAVALAASVTEPDIGERCVGAAMETFGSLDIIVNNAGYTWDNVIQKTADEQWQAMLECHLTGPFRILRAAQPVLKDLRRADLAAGRDVTRKVVNVSSVAGLFGNPGQTGYATAKAGIVGMTMTLAKEWGRLQTTVNCVAFGFIETRLTVATGDSSTATIGDRTVPVGIDPAVKAAVEASIPLGRTGSTEDAAGAIYLFCCPESDYVSGQTLLCSGGVTGI